MPSLRPSLRALSTAVAATAVAAGGVLASVPAAASAAPAAPAAESAADRGDRNRGQRFDLQAHRGGLGLTVESTLASFARALEIGVSTLELDIQITEDRQAVITHDRRISPAKCQDTAPVVPGDPEFPYVGKYVNTLTFAQVRTLDCGSLTLPQHPGQQPSPGAQMPTLDEVFDLVKAYRAERVRFNIELKVEAGAPSETAPREQFVQVVLTEVREARMLDRVSIQSFDWGTLMRVGQVEPRLPLVALTNGQQFLQAGQPGASPWLGGIDIDDFPGSLQQQYVAAVQTFGADAVSPVHGDPQGGGVETPGYVPFTTAELVEAAHAARLEVIPWTVNDIPTMRALVELGVDGLITDYPDRLRTVLDEYGYRLPKAYERRARP